MIEDDLGGVVVLGDLVGAAAVRLVHEARTSDASKIRCTSIGKFKGLESDVVVLVDGGLLSPGHRRSLEYVGVSRGKHHVVVVD